MVLKFEKSCEKVCFCKKNSLHKQGNTVKFNIYTI